MSLTKVTYSMIEGAPVSVLDFGAVGDGVANDTAAFQSAADVGGQIFVPSGTYKIVGEVIFGSNTTLEVANGTVFTMDISGENGRGFWFRKAINSGIVGSFTINASATSLGSSGDKNSCIQFGNDINDAAPTITQFCFAKGSIEINLSGTLNVKGVYLGGWVEDTIVEGVVVTGRTNFAITAHWSSPSWPLLPSQTWHAHNITIRNCKIYQKAGFIKPQRGFTFSASGRVVLDNCYADCTTLGYNLFVGDYGYPFAQNLTQDQGFNFSILNCYLRGEGGFSADSVSSGVNASPIWNGFDHNATVLVDGLDVDANDHSTGLEFGITGLDKGIFKNINLYSDNVTHTREFFYHQLCNQIQVVNSTFKHHTYMRLRSTDYVLVDGCHISKPAPTPNDTSYSITVDTVGFANITNSTIKDARTGVYAVTNTDKSIRLVNNTFEQIGAACLEVSYCSKLIVANNTFKDVGTTTTSVNINCLFLDTSVTGFSITGNLFSTNNYRYLISMTASAANGVITGNAFLDLNTGVSTPAAINKNVAAQNVMIASNVLGSGVALLYPVTTSYTIASGAITIDDPRTPVYILLDTEGAAATDDLDTISGGYEEQVVVMTSSSSSRDITFKDGTGNMALAGEFLANNNSDTITLIKRGSTWYEVSRSDNL